MTNWQPMMSSSLREIMVSVASKREACPAPRHSLLALEGGGHVGGLGGADPETELVVGDLTGVSLNPDRSIRHPDHQDSE